MLQEEQFLKVFDQGEKERQKRFWNCVRLRSGEKGVEKEIESEKYTRERETHVWDDRERRDRVSFVFRGYTLRVSN